MANRYNSQNLKFIGKPDDIWMAMSEAANTRRIFGTNEYQFVIKRDLFGFIIDPINTDQLIGWGA